MEDSPVGVQITFIRCSLSDPGFNHLPLVRFELSVKVCPPDRGIALHPAGSPGPEEQLCNLPCYGILIQDVVDPDVFHFVMTCRGAQRNEENDFGRFRDPRIIGEGGILHDHLEHRRMHAHNFA